MEAAKKRRGRPPQNFSKEHEKTREEFLFHNILQVSNRVHCDFCEKDITRHTRILCPECKFDICVNCFANAVEKDGHVSTHDYHVVSKLNFPLLTHDWTAEEELLLLEGTEKFGFGNWPDIAEHVGTKNKTQCKKHYEDVYMSNKQFLPSNFRILATRNENTLELQIIPPPKRDPKMEEENEEDLEKSERKTKSLTQDSKREPYQTTGARTSAKGALKTNKDQIGNVSEIVGYMPLRGDFDIEYDNDAELLLAEMEFYDDDKDNDLEMKFKILDIYNARLDERLKRKKFVIERDMLDLRKQNMLDRTRTKEEKEIYNLLKIFARFNTPEDHEKLVQGIIKERQIRARIEELRFYRKIGIKTFEEVEAYLAEKRRRDDAYQKKQRQNEAFIFEKKNKLNTPRRTRFKGDFIEAKDGFDKKRGNVLTMAEYESKLCEKLGITPHEYLLIKDVLVRECVKEGYISRNFAEETFNLDKDRINGVFDFLVVQNMIIEKQSK